MSSSNGEDSISRNILECKYFLRCLQCCTHLCISRNILECKYWFFRFIIIITSVLVETYWNVNKEDESHKKALELVLVETYWNVNFYVVNALCKFFYCICRNILECK